jgi:integrase
MWVQGEFGESPDNPGANPMAVLAAPKVPENEPKAMTLDQAKELIATCGTGRKRDFIDIRDEAILRLFFEAGPRRNEVASAELAWLSMTRKQLLLPGEVTKTNTGRAVPFGDRTALAINRYLVARDRHPKANTLPELWLAKKGAFTPGGIYQMVRRRGQAIGIKSLHPHMFRHTFANLYLDGGGTEDELKRLGGWESDSQVRHYSRARATNRALAAHAALALGDQL